MKKAHHRIALPQEAKDLLIQKLNPLLSTTLDLKSQAKHAHWNVKGPHFYSFHALFDKAAEVAESTADELAERIASLGGIAHGTVRQSAEYSLMQEFPVTINGDIAYLEAVTNAIGNTAAQYRQTIGDIESAGDPVTTDMLTEMLTEIEDILYHLEASLG